MMRKAAAVLAAIGCLMASQVNALGLGTLTLESSLNQPLRARIEIVDLGGVSPSDIVVSMGSQQDFQRFDLERMDFFADVDFSVESTPDGVYVELSSNQSVREPYLSFILDTRWPSGRILSEHTVLLDLPVFSDGRSIAEPINQPVSPVVETAPAVAQQQPEETTATDAVSEPQEVNTEPETELPAEPARLATQTAASDDDITTATADGVEIQESDTLWEIAMRVRPDDSVSIQQTMLALQRLNPDAFVSGNINRLRAGETLRVPDLSQIQSVNQQQAVSEVTRQNQQANLNIQPLTSPASGPSSLATDEQQGQLRVLTNEAVESASSSASAAVQAENAELDARIQALENQLALQEEEADRARLQQAELVARLSDLDAQIVAAMEIINLQDQQLAQLQQSLAEAARQPALQQEQAAVESAQQVVPATETQPLSSGQPSIVDSVSTVLNNNSMVLIVVGLLVVLLMVMLLMRRNRAVTEEGLEVGFDGDMEADSVDATVLQPQEADRSEPEAVPGAAAAGLTGAAFAEADGEREVVEEVVEEFFEEPTSGQADFSDQEGEEDLEDFLEVESATDLVENPDAERDESGLMDKDTGIEVDVFDSDNDEGGEPEQAGADAGSEEIEEMEGEEEIVDFELDTEIEAAEEEARAEDTVDFDIDEFLDEDETLEAQDDEQTDDSETDSEQGIDFELDTEAEEDQQEDEVDNGLDFDEVAFASADDDDIEPLEVDSEADDDTDSGLDLDSFGLEDDDATEQSSEADADQGEEIESLDFDLSETGISDFESEEGSIDLEADVGDNVETFDFDLGVVEAGDNESDHEPDESTGQAAEEHEGVDFELSDELLNEEPADEAGQSGEEIEDLLEIEFEPDDEAAQDTEKDLQQEAEAEPEPVEAEPSDGLDGLEETEKLEEEAEQANEIEAFQVEESAAVSGEPTDTAESNTVETEEAEDLEADEAETIEFEKAGEDKPEADQAEDQRQAGQQGESASEVEVSSDDAIEFEAEAPGDTLEEDEADAPVIEDQFSEEAAEDADAIEFIDESSDGNDTDEIAEVLAQDEQVAAPDAEVELSELDFLSTENDSAIEGADQDPELLSDDDEAATKLDLAYAYQKMGDFDGAKEILEEVLREGNDAQVSEAKNLIESLQR